MEYSVNAASSACGNHKVNNYHSSAMATLICASTKSMLKPVSKENIKPPSQGVLLRDRISELPTDIVVDILSKLKLKESGSTSILSKRWRYMWTTVYNLDFDGSDVLVDVERKIKCMEVEQPRYVSCVNQALTRHQGQTIDQFVIVFTLDDDSRSDIDRWVNFAVRKRVQRLILDLSTMRAIGGFVSYSFPNSPEISSCRSLTSLHLAGLDITGEMLELFLHNCLNLERVYVRQSHTLRRLNIDGSSLKLKWLDIICHRVEWLSVSAPNLVSFHYTGNVIPMPLKDVPKLLDLSIEGRYGYYINTRLTELSCYFSQLEKLTLGAWLQERHRKPEDVRFPVFPKLTHLTLSINNLGPTWRGSIVDYASLINACPSLYYFSFQTWINSLRPASQPPKGGASPNKIREVVLNGFQGESFEVEMAKYLIGTAVMLEKITFETVIRKFKGRWVECDGLRPEEIAGRDCAIELGKMLRPNVELVIT